MSTIYEEEHAAVEELAAELYQPVEDGTFGLPNAWGTLKIDMTLMPEEKRQKVYAAELLLREAGIGFDVGSGGGYREWELDWSLSGACLNVRTLWCLAKHEGEESDRPKWQTNAIGDDIYWAIIRHKEAGIVLSYAFCSSECREKGVEERVNNGYEHIINVEG